MKVNTMPVWNVLAAFQQTTVVRCRSDFLNDFGFFIFPGPGSGPDFKKEFVP
jgi:hypothetical protein